MHQPEPNDYHQYEQSKPVTFSLPSYSLGRLLNTDIYVLHQLRNGIYSLVAEFTKDEVFHLLRDGHFEQYPEALPELESMSMRASVTQFVSIRSPHSSDSTAEGWISIHYQLARMFGLKRGDITDFMDEDDVIHFYHFINRSLDSYHYTPDALSRRVHSMDIEVLQPEVIC